MAFLSRPDGSPTASNQEMDKLLKVAKGRINHKYAQGPEPCPEAFYNQVRALVAQAAHAGQVPHKIVCAASARSHDAASHGLGWVEVARRVCLVQTGPTHPPPAPFVQATPMCKQH